MLLIDEKFELSIFSINFVIFLHVDRVKRIHSAGSRISSRHILHNDCFVSIARSEPAIFFFFRTIGINVNTSSSSISGIAYHSSTEHFIDEHFADRISSTYILSTDTLSKDNLSTCFCRKLFRRQHILILTL